MKGLHSLLFQMENRVKQDQSSWWIVNQDTIKCNYNYDYKDMLVKDSLVLNIHFFLNSLLTDLALSFNALCARMLSCFSHVQLFVILWTVASQAPLTMWFSRQEYWSRVPLPSLVRSMNQGKLEVVKQEMARVNTNILGMSELKWTGTGKFNSDDHYIYYCGK